MHRFPSFPHGGGPLGFGTGFGTGFNLQFNHTQTRTHTSSVSATHRHHASARLSLRSPSCSLLNITITGHPEYRRLVALLLFANHSARALAACRLHVERRRRHLQRLTQTLLSSHGRLHVVSHDAVHAHDILPRAGQLEWPATSRLRRCGAVLCHGVCASTVALSSGRVAVALLWRQRRRGVTAGGGTRATGARALAARQRAARRAAAARPRRRRCAATARRRRSKALHQERVQAAKGGRSQARNATTDLDRYIRYTS